MGKVFFAIGIHNHQPVGNFDFVFEEAYHRAYRPFIDLLKEYPEVRLAMHYSGILWEWFEACYPEFTEDLDRLVKKGQVEMVGGGFYEPILPIIPRQDAIGQIKKMHQYLHDRFGVEPLGAWIPERVWEPHLPGVLYDAGIRYALLDDIHFRYAGIKPDDLDGFFTTEDSGKTIDLFPIHKALRYSIPFQKAQKTIDYLLQMSDGDHDTLAVFADDGEKFGIWPETFKHVYTDGWLREFFELLMAHKDVIELVHFSDAIRRLTSKGLLYVPTASYSEMGHWALPAVDYANYDKVVKQFDESDPDLSFLKGGFWRNFFVKYSEANHMHKRMMRVSRRLERLSNTSLSDEQHQILRVAKDHLWAGQCNCPYWHGVFGGLYLNNIRFRIYQELLRAETMADVIDHGENRDWCRVEETDFDCDGRSEILIETAHTNVYFDAEGHVLEWDTKDVPMNVTDVLTRRYEGYHELLRQTGENRAAELSHEIDSIHDRVTAKEEGLEARLLYDRERRVSFRERWFDKAIRLDDMIKGKGNAHGLEGPTFADRTTARRAELHWRGTIAGTQGGALEKTFILTTEGELHMHCTVSNTGQETLAGRFGLEMNFTLLAGSSDDRYYVIDGIKPPFPQLNSQGEDYDCREVALIDEWQRLQIRMTVDRPATLWRYPIETVSQSEEGFERVYQGSCIFPFWEISLKPSAAWHVEVKAQLTRNILYTTGGQHEA